MRENQIISIDPGREKCGIAVVHNSLNIIYKAIIETAYLSETVKELAENHSINMIIIGDGTTSQAAQRALNKIKVKGQALIIISVNEYRTTDDARKRYWAENPPNGFKRLIPTTLQVPPVPVDDYVAIILAERFFTDKKNSLDM